METGFGTRLPELVQRFCICPQRKAPRRFAAGAFDDGHDVTFLEGQVVFVPVDLDQNRFGKQPAKALQVRRCL